MAVFIILELGVIELALLNPKQLNMYLLFLFGFKSEDGEGRRNDAPSSFKSEGTYPLIVPRVSPVDAHVLIAGFDALKSMWLKHEKTEIIFIKVYDKSSMRVVVFASV